MSNTKKTVLSILAVVLIIAMTVAATLAFYSDEERLLNTFTVGKVRINLDEAEVNAEGKPIKTDDNGDDVVVTDLTEANRVSSNRFKLLSGVTDYTKDPTVTIKKGSEACYVRLIMTVDLTRVADFNELETTIKKYIAGSFGPDVKYGTFLSGLNTTDWVWQRPTNAVFAPASFSDQLVLDVDGDNVLDMSDVTLVRGIKNGAIEAEEYLEYTFEFRYKEMIQASSMRNSDLVLSPLFTGIHVDNPEDYLRVSFCDGLGIEIEAQAIQADGFNDADEAWAAFDAQP